MVDKPPALTCLPKEMSMMRPRILSAALSLVLFLAVGTSDASVKYHCVCKDDYEIYGNAADCGAAINGCSVLCQNRGGVKETTCPVPLVETLGLCCLAALLLVHGARARRWARGHARLAWQTPRSAYQLPDAGSASRSKPV